LCIDGGVGVTLAETAPGIAHGGIGLAKAILTISVLITLLALALTLLALLSLLALLAALIFLAALPLPHAALGKLLL
jgi:hypothetical protein